MGFSITTRGYVAPADDPSDHSEPLPHRRAGDGTRVSLTDPAASGAVRNKRPGEPYKPGEAIGTPWGSVDFIGYDEGFVVVASRTTRYRLAEKDLRRDSVRNRVIDSVRKGEISTPLYGAPRTAATDRRPSAIQGIADPYTDVGWNRPISESAGAGLKALLKRFPGASQVLEPLLKSLPMGAPGKSDALRLELDTSLLDGSFTLHVKLNLAGLLSLPRDRIENIFNLAIAKAPNAQEKVQAIALKRMAMEWYDRPGLKDNRLLKTTDLRLTFNPTRWKDGFRVGLATLFMTPPLGGKNGPEAMLAVSPRIAFDPHGHPTGVVLVAFGEVDSPTSRHGFWAGIGLPLIGSLDSAGASALRRDANGVPGIELSVQGKPRFVALPSLVTVLNGIGVDSAKLPVSNAVHASSEDVARAVLNSTDPKVIASLRSAATTLEKTSAAVGAGKAVLDGVSQVRQVLTFAAGLSTGSVLAAAAAAVPLALAWEDKLSDGTVAGALRQHYATDSGEAFERLQAIGARLSSERPLSDGERRELLADLVQIAAFDARWQARPELEKFYNRLPPKERFPWDGRSRAVVKSSIDQHP